MTKPQCPWGYKYNKAGTKKTVNKKHVCNVSCWEHWTLRQCAEWAARTPYPTQAQPPTLVAVEGTAQND